MYMLSGSDTHVEDLEKVCGVYYRCEVCDAGGDSSSDLQRGPHVTPPKHAIAGAD